MKRLRVGRGESEARPRDRGPGGAARSGAGGASGGPQGAAAGRGGKARRPGGTRPRPGPAGAAAGRGEAPSRAATWAPGLRTLGRGEGAGAGRRSLSHVGGRVDRLSGPSELAELVRRALSVNPERGVRDHVHGFHSYPARMHPHTAARLIEALSEPGGKVTDPFCGGGTVVVEARRLGRRGAGVDLNPLAVRLTRFKVEPLAAPQRQQVGEAAARICEQAEERRLTKAGPTRKYSAGDREAFDIHVLLELDGIASGIKREARGEVAHALLLALSSTFSKLAKQSTGPEGGAKRLASGFAITFYQARVSEMLGQLAAYEELLPPGAPPGFYREGDARELSKLGLAGVDLIVTSPPYPGVLDYADYHRTRLSWLGLSRGRFEHEEMGARRQLQRLGHRDAAARWEDDFSAALEQMRRVLAPGGRIALLLADSMLCGEPYPGDAMTARCAGRAGLRVLAQGAQRRPHFHRASEQAFGRRPRFEHLILLAATEG